MKLTGSQIFVEVLVEQGVDTLFGYPGGAVLNLYDELYKNSDRIRHVLTAHEQGASHAADGYARATGRTGVVLATSGPGATNLVTGIATAYMDSVPMVAFTGNVATTLLGKDSFQEAYIEGITMPITKHNYTVRRVEDLADTMRAAFRIAQSGRKGPVLVDIPKDITAASCEFTPKAPELIRTVTYYNEEDVKEAARLINESERPIVYFGGGVRSAAGCQPLRDLLEKTGMPATYTLMAAGVLSYGEPHNLGLLGMHGCYAANKAIDRWGIKVNRVELKNIEPPVEIRQAMEKQMKADREKRASILLAEGEKQAAITRAEGEKESAILRAEAVKQQRIREAEGEAEALLTVQKAQADAIRMINEANPNHNYLALRSMEAMEKVADGKATKLIVPSDMQNLAATVSAIKEISGEVTK